MPRRARHHRFALALAALAALLAASCVPPPPPPTTTAVLPLGDSNTVGYPEPGGYRVELERRLLEAAVDHDLVGPNSSGPATMADRDHAGFTGDDIGELRSRLPQVLGASDPDLILLMVGTNDLKVAADVPTVLAEYGALLDEIAALEPGARILAADLPPQRPALGDGQVQQFNAGLPGAVSAAAGRGVDVRAVAVGSAVRRDQLADDLHPTAGGYAAMGTAWYGALVPELPDPPPGPLFADAFDRPDGPLGGSWVGLGSTSIGIAGGQARASAGGGEGVALVDVGATDVTVASDVTLSPDRTNVGFSLRATDERTQLVAGITRRSDLSAVSLFAVQDGAYRQLVRLDRPFTPGSTVRLEVALDGAQVVVRIDGVVAFTHVLSAADQATFTGDRHGLRAFRSATGEDGGSRWDRFEVR